MSATMSLLGLYQNNPGMFGELELPEGIDHDTVVNNLLAETAELEILYPQPYLMQAMIGIWSHKELPVWQKLYDTTLLKYNPIQNYDRKEKWTEDENTTKNTDSESTGTSKTQTTNDGETKDETEENGAVSRFTSAYNETEFTPTGRDATNNQTLQNGTTHNEGDINSQTKNGFVSDESGKRLTDREGEISGNTGFYTKQKMIEQEREIALFNMYDVIIASFKNRFCLLIY